MAPTGAALTALLPEFSLELSTLVLAGAAGVAAAADLSRAAARVLDPVLETVALVVVFVTFGFPDLVEVVFVSALVLFLLVLVFLVSTLLLVSVFLVGIGNSVNQVLATV